MTVPVPLREFLVGARSCIERATNFDAAMLIGNAEASIRNAKAFVRPTPAIDSAFDDAIEMMLQFHEEVADQNTLTRINTASIENARQLALIALDRLEAALSDAKSNDEAAALGIDWF